MSISPFQQEEFVALLNKFILLQRSIDDLLRHTKFQQLLRKTCGRFNFRHFNGVYDRDDLYQDSHVKVEKSAHRLQVQGNILTEEDFSDWLFVLVLNVLRSKDRQLNRLRRHGLQRSVELIEKLELRAPEHDLDGGYFLRLFLEFTKDDPEETKCFIDLWLIGYSLREIEESLKGQGKGSKASYGTVRNVINARIKAFMQSLGLPKTEPQKKHAQKR